MRLKIDWDRCEGNGRCEASAPDVFSLDDEGDMHLTDDTVTTEVPVQQLAAVTAAVHACPLQVLRLVP